MESEHIKAAGNKVAGTGKAAVGDVTDTKTLKTKGKAEQMKAKVQDAIGDVKDAVE